MTSQAYQDGLRTGQIDRQLGIRSDYSYYSVNSTNAYVREYAQGYRAGYDKAVR